MSEPTVTRDTLIQELGFDPRSAELQAAFTSLEQQFRPVEAQARAVEEALAAMRAAAVASAQGARPLDRSQRIKPVSSAVSPEVASAVSTVTSVTLKLMGVTGPELPKPELQTTWKNVIGNQHVEAAFAFRPRTLGDVVAIVRFAEQQGRHVRAVGSGHSFSDVALVGTRDVVVDTHAMNDPLDLEAHLLKPGAPRLFRVEAGIRLTDLLETLDANGLAIQNMGNYSAQTIAGATATGTHGSGLRFGPMAEQIRSLELVASEGRVLRVEPTNGITDPVAFAAHQSRLAGSDPDFIPIQLVQDDDTYRAAALGVGCLGILYSVTLEVLPRYWLKETRTVRPWSEVREELRAEFARLARGEAPQLFAPRHYELLLNPYETKGQRTCLVTVREEAPDPSGSLIGRPHRPLTGKLLSMIPGAGAGIAALTNMLPQLLPGIVDMNIKGQEDDGYVNLSYKVLRSADTGCELLDDLPDFLTGFSASMAFPLETALDAIERLLAREGAPAPEHMTGPIKIRFVKPSPLHLAMQNGPESARAVCMVEPMLLVGTTRGFDSVHWVMESTLAFGGRPHWGLNFAYMDGKSVFDRLTRPYPGLERWKAVFQQFNPRGTFDNAFTDHNHLRG